MSFDTIKSVMEYNSNSTTAIFWGLMKSVLPREWIAIVEVGCQIESKCPSILTLTELYMQPTPAEATGYMLLKAREMLSTRATNEDSFRL